MNLALAVTVIYVLTYLVMDPFAGGNYQCLIVRTHFFHSLFIKVCSIWTFMSSCGPCFNCWLQLSSVKEHACTIVEILDYQILKFQSVLQHLNLTRKICLKFYFYIEIGFWYDRLIFMSGVGALLMLSLYLATGQLINTVPQVSGYPLWQVQICHILATSQYLLNVLRDII